MFIYDREQVAQFAKILEPIEQNEFYYGVVLARKKYGRESTVLLSDFTVQPKHLLRTLINLDHPYVVDGETVSPDTISIMIRTSPINPEKFRKHSLLELAQANVNDWKLNPLHFVRSLFQATACTRRVFYGLDIDDIKEPEDLDLVHYRIKTHGGYHLLIPIRGQQNPKWYTELHGLNFDKEGYFMSPIPGTLQGGKEVSFESVTL